jgi:hypothetical protein
VKYDPAGGALWAVAPYGTNFEVQTGMALVNNQEIYLAGYFFRQVSFDSFNLFDSNPTNIYSFYLAKFAADTTAAVTLGLPQLNAGGTQLQFSVAGVPGYQYAIEASTNLITWTPLLTNTSPFIFCEPIAPVRPQRFYRSAYRP